MLMSAADAELGALVVAGVDPGDLMSPQSALEGLEQVGFVISIEQRASSVTERADVVLPVSLIEERAGSFLTWEGRERPFGVVIKKDNVMTDLRVLAALSDLLGQDLGIRNADEASAELAELGPWDGHVAPAPNIEPGRASVPGTTTVVLATWRLAIDASRSVDNEPELLATARRPVARLSTATAAAAGIGDRVWIENDHGSLQLPVELVPEMADGVVWMPTLAPGLGVADRLAAAAGDVVRISAPTDAVTGDDAASDSEDVASDSENEQGA